MLNKINISSSKQKLIVYIVLTIATLVVYWQVNQYDFVNYDDNVYVHENIHIQSGFTLDGLRWVFSSKYTGLWNPLVWLSFMFDYQLYGLNAGGYHITNLIFHILSSLLLFWLFDRMTGAIWRSAFVAALFALHPLHVESVAWISERKDVLSAFFWMLTLCLYVYYTEKPVIQRYLSVLLCFACALMSKPMVITLPIIIILLDYWPLGRFQQREIVPDLTDAVPVYANKGEKKKKSKKEALKNNISPANHRKLPEAKIAGIIPIWQLREKIPFFVLSAIVVIITLYAPIEQEISFKNIPLGRRIVNVPISFVTYLEKTFWPHDMAVFYPFPTQIPIWQALGAFLLIILFSAAVIVMAKRMPYLFIGLMWYAITIAPVIGIIQISLQAPYAMADRYHYLPSIGIAVMLAWGIPFLIKSDDLRIRLLLPLGVVSIAILSFLTWQQCSYWKNSIKLWNHTLPTTKNIFVVHKGLADALFTEGKIEEAIYHYNEAIRLRPDDFITYTKRGFVYASIGQHQRAFNDFNETIRLKPNHTLGYYNRGIFYYGLGQRQLAIKDFSEAIRLKPDFASPYKNRAIAYFEQGNKELGCSDAQKACELGNCKLLEVAKSNGYCR